MILKAQSKNLEYLTVFKPWEKGISVYVAMITLFLLILPTSHADAKTTVRVNKTDKEIEVLLTSIRPADLAPDHITAVISEGGRLVGRCEWTPAPNPGNYGTVECSSPPGQDLSMSIFSKEVYVSLTIPHFRGEGCTKKEIEYIVTQSQVSSPKASVVDESKVTVCVPGLPGNPTQVCTRKNTESKLGNYKNLNLGMSIDALQKALPSIKPTDGLVLSDSGGRSEMKWEMKIFNYWMKEPDIFPGHDLAYMRINLLRWRYADLDPKNRNKTIYADTFQYCLVKVKVTYRDLHPDVMVVLGAFKELYGNPDKVMDIDFKGLNMFFDPSTQKVAVWEDENTIATFEYHTHIFTVADKGYLHKVSELENEGTLLLKTAIEVRFKDFIAKTLNEIKPSLDIKAVEEIRPMGNKKAHESVDSYQWYYLDHKNLGIADGIHFYTSWIKKDRSKQDSIYKVEIRFDDSEMALFSKDFVVGEFNATFGQFKNMTITEVRKALRRNTRDRIEWLWEFQGQEIRLVANPVMEPDGRTDYTYTLTMVDPELSERKDEYPRELKKSLEKFVP